MPGFTRAVDLNRFTFNVDVSFRGVINAGYYNMVGTYTLDENGCPQNAQLVLDNKKNWESKIGETIVNIEMPPQTKMFFLLQMDIEDLETLIIVQNKTPLYQLKIPKYLLIIVVQLIVLMEVVIQIL